MKGNTLKYENLSQEAKETLIGMVEFCINNGFCMGMDEGLDFDSTDDLESRKPQPFRAELEKFVQYYNETSSL